MPTCPTCDGTKKVTVTVKQFGVEGETESRQTCHVCHGQGTVSEDGIAELKVEQGLWCSCGNPSKEVSYWADGENSNCSKHCYTCDDCGKIVQVG